MIAAKLQKLSGREKACFILAVVFILAYVGDQLVVSRVLSHFKNLSLETEKQKIYLEYNLDVLQHEVEVAAEYEKVKDRFGEVSASSKPTEALTGQIHELARQTGLTIVSCEQREPRRGEFCYEFSVELKQFKAETDQLLKFLYELRAAPGMLRVVKLSLAPASSVAGAQSKGVQGSMIVTKKMIPVR